MNLQEFIQKDLEKLLKRLNKESINSVSDMDYDKYLRSKFLKKIREWVLNRDDGKCRLCMRKAGEVHHKSYELDVLEGKNHEQLVSLCSRCHKLIEFDGERKVPSLVEKDERLIYYKNIHDEMIGDGINFTIEKIKSGQTYKIVVKYTDQGDYLKFINLAELFFDFIHRLKNSNRDALRYVLPFGLDKFYQKSGAKLLNKESGKEILRINIDKHNVVIVKMTKHCKYDIYSEVIEYFKNNKKGLNKTIRYVFNVEEI